MLVFMENITGSGRLPPRRLGARTRIARRNKRDSKLHRNILLKKKIYNMAAKTKGETYVNSE